MRQTNLKRFAFLLAGVATMVSCTKQFSDVYDPNYLQEQAKEAFPVKNIDPTHTWAMMSTRTASVKVDGVVGAAYTVKIYSENPVLNASAPLMVKATATGGQTASISFDAPTALERVFVSREGSDGRFVVAAELSNNMFVGTFESGAASRTLSRAASLPTGSPFPLEGTKVSVPSDIDAIFPTSVPSDALVAPSSIDNNTTSTKLLLTSGTYDVHYWSSVGKRELYIDRGATVEFSRLYSGTDLTLYMLSGSVLKVGGLPKNGNFTLIMSEGSSYELNGKLTLTTEHKLKIYNKGTIKASSLTFENKGAEVFNYGTLDCSSIHSSTGAGSASIFYNAPTGTVATGNVSLGGGGCYMLNDGDFKGADLTIDITAFQNNGNAYFDSVLLEGSGNLYNSGKMIVADYTHANNSGCYWINSGYFKTGSMYICAQNKNCYNYCHLIVDGLMELNDGLFNVMDDGYIQAKKLSLHQVEMKLGSRSVVYVTDKTTLYGKGNGIFQGFRGVGTQKALVKLGGQTIKAAGVEDADMLCFFGTLQYAVNEIFTEKEGTRQIHYDDTAEGVNYGEVSLPTPTEEQCAPNWSIGNGGGSTEDDPYLFTYAFEDMTKEVGDYDFNDVVLQATAPVDGKIKVTLLAAGATKELRVGFNNKAIEKSDVLLFDGKTVYEVLGVPVGTITNTNTSNGEISTVEIEVGRDFRLRAHGDFYIVDRTNVKIHIPEFTVGFEPGNVPYAIRVPKDWAYPRERISIEVAYPDFKDWAQDAKTSTNWYDNPVEEYVFKATE